MAKRRVTLTIDEQLMAEFERQIPNGYRSRWVEDLMRAQLEGLAEVAGAFPGAPRRKPKRPSGQAESREQVAYIPKGGK